ncbi:LexA family protein [Microbacterium gorillae]|uniref:LexA family protein n=1 Tax=Microbacterium gorillae TaxID=1231063 RepID=UPI003D95AAC4
MLQQVDPENLSEIMVPLAPTAVPAGYPSPAQDWYDGPINLTKILIEDDAATYLVRVVGESMIGAGIWPGDVAIVSRAKTPTDTDVVVAIINGELTIKRLLHRPGASTHHDWVLHPENPDMPDIVIDEWSEALIWGVSTVSFRWHRPPPGSLGWSMAMPRLTQAG